MNRKGMETFYMILMALAVVFLLALVFSFANPTKKFGEKLFGEEGWFGKDFLQKFTLEEETTTAIIDEERIDEDTPPVLIGYLPYDKESEKQRVIIKNSYGKKWNLIYYKGTERITEVSEKSLQEILDSEYLRGSITVAEKVYIHSPSRNNFQWFADTTGNYDYDEGKDEAITSEALAQLIVADLFEKAKEESS